MRREERRGEEKRRQDKEDERRLSELKGQEREENTDKCRGD